MGAEAYPGHDGGEEEEEALPVPGHVGLGELDADGKDTDGEDDTGELEGDGVGGGAVAVAPAAGVEDVGTVRALTGSARTPLRGWGCSPMMTPNRNAQHASPM